MARHSTSTVVFADQRRAAIAEAERLLQRLGEQGVVIGPQAQAVLSRTLQDRLWRFAGMSGTCEHLKPWSKGWRGHRPVYVLGAGSDTLCADCTAEAWLDGLGDCSHCRSATAELYAGRLAAVLVIAALCAEHVEECSEWAA